MNNPNNKIEKLREINSSINKRISELETYMFIENINVNNIITSNNKVSKKLVDTK